MNWREIIRGDICRLRNVIRWSNCRRTHNESVAEHVHFTSYYSMLIAYWLEENGTSTINYRRLYESAITHDDEEALTGDIPRSFKYAFNSLREIIGIASSQAHGTLLNGLDLPPRVHKELTCTWESSKDTDRIEGQIVSLADFISVLSYLYQEMEAGNTGILERSNSIILYYSQFDSTVYKILHPLIEILRPLVLEVSNSMSKT